MPLIKINTFNSAGLTGTLPNAVFPATLPATSAANLTNIPAGNLTGFVDAARLPLASDSAQGIVLIGTNLTIVSGTLSLVSGNVTAALGFTPENVANKGQANGYASLDSGGKIPAAQLPAIAISDTFVVASQVAMLALTAQIGDVAVRTDLNKSFILKDADATLLASWQELLTPTDAVQSVNGATGVVVLDAGDIGISAITGVTATDVQGALAEHQSDIEGLDGRLDTAESDILALDGRIDTLEADTSVANHLSDAVDAHDASAISFVSGTTGLGVDTVQAAIEALDTNIDTVTSDLATTNSNLSNHLSDATDAHDASAISFVSGTTGLGVDTVQAAIEALDTNVDAVTTSVATVASDLANHLADAVDAHDASAVSFVSGTTGLGVDTVQAAIEALDTNVDAVTTGLSDHLSDATDAHDASAISVAAISGLTATDVQAALAEHQSDIEGKQATLGYTAENTANKGQANGYASLGADGKIPTGQVPAIAITDTFVVASQVAMLALTAQTGDVAIRTDLNKTFILKGTDPTVLADWEELLSPTNAVQSVNGQTGTVVLDSDDVAEGSTNLYFTNGRAQTAIDSAHIQSQLTGDITTHHHNTNDDARYARLAVTNDFTTVQNITRTVNGQGAALRVKNLDTNTAVGTGFQMHLANTSGTDIVAGAIYVSKDGSWDTTAANQDAKLQFFLAKDGTNASRATLDSDGKFTATSFEGSGALVTNVSAAKAPTQAFAQLWAVGILDDFVGSTVVDYYVNSGGAKTLGKIVLSSDLSGSTGTIEVDILKKDTVNGSLTTLFTTVALPTLTANGGLTWTVVTGANLPDVVSIPDGAVLVLQITNAPVDAENIKVELYEV